jgi:hypothetical protein
VKDITNQHFEALVFAYRECFYELRTTCRKRKRDDDIEAKTAFYREKLLTLQGLIRIIAEQIGKKLEADYFGMLPLLYPLRQAKDLGARGD